MTDRRPAKNGRKAFKGMAPKGYAIRMMEPGEVPALLALEKNSPDDVRPRRSDPPDIHAFTRFLLANEVFVAVTKKTNETVGYAAAAAESDLYWLSRLTVHEDHRDGALQDALLKAVSERAHWFFYRALGLSIDEASSDRLPFYEKHGFLKIPRSDLPEWLEEKRKSECLSAGSEDQVVMLKWL